MALAKYSPAFLVVDRQYSILRYSGGEVAQYLESSPGVASLGLLSNLRKTLRIVARTALRSVVKTGVGVGQRGASVDRRGIADLEGGAAIRQ